MDASRGLLSSASDSASSPSAAASAVIWPRSEVFEYGILPLPTKSKIDLHNLLALVRKYRHIHEINSKYFTVINSLHLDSGSREFSQTFAYPEWETVGSDDLKLYDAYIKSAFDRFCSLRQIRVGHRKRSVIENQTVNFYEFLIFLYIQLIGRVSYAASAARGAHWPSNNSSNSPSSFSMPMSPSKLQPGLSNSSPLASPNRRSPYKRRSADQPQLLISQMGSLLSPQRTPGRVPPLQLSSVRSGSGKRDFIDRLDLGLEEQKQFLTEHIDHILLLLSADEPSGNIAAHELDALGFLLAIGPDMFSRFDSKFSDAVPDSIEPILRQDARSPSLTTVFYPRDDIAQWICDALTVNTYLYAPQKRNDVGSPSSISGGLRGAAVVPLEEPIGIFHATGMTLFKTDKASIPEEAPTGPLLSARDRKDSLSSASAISPNSSSSSVPSAPPSLTTSLSAGLLQPSASTLSMAGSASSASLPTSNSSPAFSSSAVNAALRQSGAIRADSPHIIEPVSQDTRIVDCSQCYIYLLKPLGHVRIESCRDSTIVLGAVGGILDIRRCKNVNIIAACHSIQVNHCQDSSFYLLTNSRPLILGVNHQLQFGPFNTHYRSIGRHLREAQVSTTQNNWADPLLLAVERAKSTAASLSSPMSSPSRSLTALEQLPYTLVKPEAFVPFRVPFELVGDTKSNPYELSAEYRSALEEAATQAIELKQAIEKKKLDKQMKDRIRAVIHAHYENWLRQTGNWQQIEDLVRLQLQSQ